MISPPIVLRAVVSGLAVTFLPLHWEVIFLGSWIFMLFHSYKWFKQKAHIEAV